MFGYVRCAAAVPRLRVGDVKYNCAEIIKQIDEARAKKAGIIVFPELCLTGYTCQDLFFQGTMRAAAVDAVNIIAEKTYGEDFAVVIGAPLVVGSALYSCAVVIANGKVAGIAPKTFLPNYNEFYEKRWFSSSETLNTGVVSASGMGFVCERDYDIPVGRDLVFCLSSGIGFGAELCEDLWTPIAPSRFLALGGAHIIVNLSASNETAAKREYREELVRSTSASLLAAYVYSSAGEDESTQDLVFSGNSIIAENGAILAENEKHIDGGYIIVADIDTEKLENERIKIKSFADSVSLYGKLQSCRKVRLNISADSDGKIYKINKLPFVPSSKKDRLDRCRNIFEMQVSGLKKRLSAVPGAKPVIGVSGGLDSTLALLVCCEAIHRLGRPASDVHAITMPCFGTTDRTYTNALELMKQLGVTSLEIPIKEACTLHCKDIGHPIDQFDVTYENVQARERTQVLMDYACKIGGFVVGTGDLSELALGWCTYNADHMSMYGVNCGVPKTLVRWLIDSMIDYDLFASCTDVLKDIIDTPISPELLPPDEKGNIVQETESIVGPYALHDFFLYNALRFGFSPTKIYRLACRAFADDFDAETVKKWLKTFYRRFFTQQFKRSCLPDGVKIGSLCLSPRGDWRMPSDASAALWLEEAESL